jgi:hypothetical protein
MFQFGIGGLYAKQVGGNAGTPNFPQRFATLQDVNLDFDGKLVELRGQNQFPDDVAPSDKNCKGKAAFGAIEIDIYNALYFADTITDGGVLVVDSEAATIPATPGPYTVTVTGSATWTEDLGVRYADGSGYLQAGSVAAGKYTVAAGVYTFAAADQGKAVLISYVKTVTGGRTLTVTNHIQGYGPVFEMYLLQPYQGANGIHIFNARASKMSAPMKRDGYLISDFEFTAYANSAGKVFEWLQTTP